jgi:DNA-binding IclR family transcriptional regulator|tara:strand:- start:877 stop:1104 length:228 start_codon:yes stop_codon:yes gene_type:complete
MTNTTFNTAERVLEVLKQDNKAFTPYELSIKTGMAFKTIVECMKKLQEWNKIEVTTNGRTRLIQLKKENINNPPQ